MSCARRKLLIPSFQTSQFHVWRLISASVDYVKDLLLVYGFYLHVVQCGVMEFIADTLKWMLELVFKAGEVRPSILRGRGRHGELGS